MAVFKLQEDYIIRRINDRLVIISNMQGGKGSELLLDVFAVNGMENFRIAKI